MVPGCAVVSSPGSRIALRTGKSRPGEHKRPKIGLKPKQAFIGGAISWQICDVQVGDGDDLESFGPQILDHALEIREALCVHGEWPIVLLIVDVQVNHISGNFSFPEFTSDLAYLRFGIVTIP